MPTKVGYIQVDGLYDINGNPITLSGANYGVITFMADGGGSAIATGIIADLVLPFSGTLQSWTLLADQASNTTIDLWKDVLANFPPTVADTITAAAKPALAAVAFNSSSALTGWTTAITAGDTMRLNLDANSAAQRITLTLVYRKT